VTDRVMPERHHQMVRYFSEGILQAL